MRYIDPWGLSIPEEDRDYEVMLGAIIAKNGGEIVRIEHGGSADLFGVVSITVRIGDVEETYRLGRDFRMVNERAIIDHTRLMEDFGLTQIQATHRTGDRFTRIEDAAMAFGLMFYQRSLDERQEWGASIRKNADGTYSFTGVTNSLTSTLTWRRRDATLDNLMDWERSHVVIHGIQRPDVVATIHTHWAHLATREFTYTVDYIQPSHINRIFLVNQIGDVLSSERPPGSVPAGESGYAGFPHFNPTRLFNIRGRG